MVTRVPGGRREQQVAQIRGEHAHGLCLGRIPQPHAQVDVEMHLDLGAPGPAHGIDHPAVAGALKVGDAEPLHDLQFIDARHAGRRWFGLGLDLEIEDFFFLAAEHCEDSVRGQLGQRLGELEIVGKLFALGFLAVAHLGGHARISPHLLAKRADQVGVFVEALDQDGAGAIECRSGIGNALLGIDEGFSDHLRIVVGLGHELKGERLEPGFLGDLGLGAALRLKRQIDVFEARLAVGSENGGLQRGIELALLADRFEDGLAAVLELAQVTQALLQRAQLCVVERTGRFLAVAGDEGNRGAAVEQRHCRLDLLRPNPKLLRNFLVDIYHARTPLSKHASRRRTTGCGTPLMDQSGLIHQGAADDRRQGIFCRSDAISPQSWVLRRRRTSCCRPGFRQDDDGDCLDTLTGAPVQRLFCLPDS
ncbi:hypothetical protein ACVWZ6_008419 [Bradyrhizobium sp. GM6.1]